MNRYTLAAATTVYLLSVVLANALTTHYGLVSAGFGLLVTAGTYAAGAALLARDFVQRHATALLGHRGGITWALGTILAGGAISYASGTGSDRIVIASTVAFLTAEIIDMGVFTPLRERAGFFTAALTSNLVSAPTDTVVFLALAGFPITANAVAGQLVAKILWATLIPLLLWALYHRRTLRTLRAA